jgi:hypothetical protein
MKILKPNKYTDVDLSVVGLGALLLKSLKNNPYQKYDALLEKIVTVGNASAKENFLLSLSFLFSMGMIKYYSDHDVIELCVK